MQNDGENEEYPLLPYGQWSNDAHSRWVDAGNTFGIHLIQHVRDTALGEISPDVSQECRKAAEQSIENTLTAMMDFLDGYFGSVIDENYTVTYALLARIRDADDTIVETIELAPDGDGLLMGYWGWREGNFGQNRKR